jgi:hypothetical protein
VLHLDYDLCNTTFTEMIDGHLELNGGFEANKKIPLLECDEAAMAVRDSGLTLEDMVPQHLQRKPPRMYQPPLLLVAHKPSIFAQRFHFSTLTDTHVMQKPASKSL